MSEAKVETSEMFRFGRRCPLIHDPGDYVCTTIEYATGNRDPDEIGAVAHFEERSFGEYL